MASLSPQMMLRPPTWVCETVAELEHEIGLAPGSLQATVTAFNEGAARGEDLLLHKKPQWLRPIGSPVGAIDLRESTGGFTLGGGMGWDGWLAGTASRATTSSRASSSPRTVR